MAARPRPSLKARGVQLLAQREHSRSELRAKLLRHARADAAARAAAHEGAAAAHGVGSPARAWAGGRSARPGGGGAGDVATKGLAAFAVDAMDSDVPEDPLAAVEAVLDWLQAHQYLDESRFVESRVHARAGRYGNLRIRQELAQHGVALSDEAAGNLRASELERARAVWARKFGEPPADAAARARQMRFLGGRGFSPDVIRRVVAGSDDD